MTWKIHSVWLLIYLKCFLILETESINYSNPISPEVFQTLAGQGFTTNYFTTDPPTKNYKSQNIDDVYLAGFRNLLFRCKADLFPYPYNTTHFTRTFLDPLESVVDKCLAVGVIPIISWINHQAEAYATDEDRQNYVTWWTKVADRLKNKDYRLAFNLFTELSLDVCQQTSNCGGSLYSNSTKYNQWTSTVILAIRGTGGNNDNRILILSSPQKSASGLQLIESSIYEYQTKIIAEHHIYASGPDNNPKSPYYWVGNGTAIQRKTLIHELEIANSSVPLTTYFGAWMPVDNKEGQIDKDEVEHFSKYFVSTLKDQGIPWSLNDLDSYYNTKNTSWITDIQNITGIYLNMSKILDVVKENM